MGCTPQVRGKAVDYRQAICTTASGKYVLNTFASDKAQQDWLEYSSMYGGTYLVGTRWVVVSSPQLLEAARQRLGGRVQDAESLHRRSGEPPSTTGTT
ncbi:hypothetical protein [Actinomadura sp. WMMA1423]|uniref:hypothetical protein n=1 Tax=Actinomadura sp. WMMA1423 TaxID=2591108 RepID=UPI001147272B|nr:hypothetical protein [Actinomadura sp. WMMA1423]